MAFPRSIPLTFRATTLCDAVDGTNGPPGAMASLANLVPDPGMRDAFICRSACGKKGTFSTATPAYAGATFVSALLVVGNTAYGMVATTRFAGHDEPFCLDLTGGGMTPVTVAGVTSANTPASPLTTGDWTPPIIKQVGSRIIVTHPGFAGGATKFGWFDVSGFSETATGNTNSNHNISGFPSILGVQPGMTITDSAGDIPADTTVVSTLNLVLSYSGTTHSNTTIDGLPADVNRAVGQVVAGAGIPAGTTITVLASGTSVTISQAATASATVPLTFTGTRIVMSAAATGSTNNNTITVAGGTLAAPLWGAGDTDFNNLPSVPVGVAQFNDRAYFACGINGIVFSDSGFPCRVSNNPNVQALTTNDGLAVTTIGELQLSSLLGGVVQSLIAFEGSAKMQQIKGDPTTNDLSMNALPAATGTLSPLSLCSTETGLAFISPNGLRIIDFNGNVSAPIGAAGDGVVVPFQITNIGGVSTLNNPSRTCAASNGRTIVISCFNNIDTTKHEYWYHLDRNCWTGPHSFAASMIQHFGDAFLKTPDGVLNTLWTADDQPEFKPLTFDTEYVENGVALTYTWLSSLLPDSGDMSMIAITEMALAASLPKPVTPATATATITLTMTDDAGNVLDTTTVVGDIDPAFWDGVAQNNSGGYLGSQVGTFRQRSVNWNEPLIFKQASLQITGNSGPWTRIGNLYMRYQHLGYKLEL